MSTHAIVQFGTSRFLQAHVDLFVSEALERGEAVGGIAMVQTSGDAARARRLSAITEGYDVQLRGLSGGSDIARTVRVSSVRTALSLHRDRHAVEGILAGEARIVVSNTADAGFEPRPADDGATLDPSMSFPAKLAHLLRPRFEAGGRTIQIMPTELVRNNGDTLRALVLDAACNMEAPYRRWLETQIVWVNSLVDRIVSEPLEPAGAVAEPYALWAIQNHPDLLIPCRHADVQVVEDLGAVERRKLFVLNLGHSWIVSRWLERGMTGARFVRDVMADPSSAQELSDVLQSEVIPAFRIAGEGDGIEAYVATTLERFANPYLDHGLSDIAANHAQKCERRIAAFLDWAWLNGDDASKPLLQRALALARAGIGS